MTSDGIIPVDEPNDPDHRLWYPGMAGLPHDDGNGTRQPGAALTVDQTIAFGKALVELLTENQSFRKQYHRISRTWHIAFNKVGHGGKFGEQWCTLLEQHLIDDVEGKIPPGTLKLDDFANLHKYAFYSLRRSLLALTSHDFHPDAANDKDDPGEVAAEALATIPSWMMSVHFGPNDGSHATLMQIDLGLAEAMP